MSSRLRYLLVLLFVVIIASLSGWLLQTVEDRFAIRESPEKQTADYFMEDFTATAMNIKGTPEYAISASYLAHFPHNDTVHMKQPYISMFRDQLDPWQLVSDSGVVSQKGTIIKLSGEVTMQKGDAGAEKSVTLSTRDLDINTKTKTADTEKEVKIVRADSILEATGMHIDLESGVLELLSNARGLYNAP